MGILHNFRRYSTLLFLYYILFSCDIGDTEPACNMPTEEDDTKITPYYNSINIINIDGSQIKRIYEAEKNMGIYFPQYT